MTLESLQANAARIRAKLDALPKDSKADTQAQATARARHKAHLAEIDKAIAELPGGTPAVASVPKPAAGG